MRDYFVGITMTIVLSLLPAYTFDTNINPIILSDRTHTLFLRFKRYVTVPHQVKYRKMLRIINNCLLSASNKLVGRCLFSKYLSLCHAPLFSFDELFNLISKILVDHVPDDKLVHRGVVDQRDARIQGHADYVKCM